MAEIILEGDALDRLQGIPAESIDTCVTSPPYYNLRDYGQPGQIGNEETVEEYIGKLVEIFREVHRVLHPAGTLWVNIGDSYATSSGPQPPTNTRNSCGHTKKSVPAGYKQKDLIGIPWLLAFALRADGWYLRQDIIWDKTRCMPESVKDRCVKSHEYLFLLSKSPKYYFDASAIQEKAKPESEKRYKSAFMAGEKELLGAGRKVGGANTAGIKKFTGKRNKRDVWHIPTAHFTGAHFAVFPEKLVEPCILAGCPEGGTVLDPFTGSGTTGAVAKQLGRNFLGIELNPAYCQIARERIAAAQPHVEQLTLEEIVP